MKKQTKVLVTLSAAALLAVGASAVSFAEGWDNSTGVWQYLDKDGEPVANEWKSSNGQWFWLDDDGNMATDSVIEDDTESKTKYYYVDANGARVSNTWKAVAKDDDDDSDAEYYWMYFGSDGKAYTTSEGDDITKSKLKTINGLKYAFDSEGHMLYGWVSKTDKNQHDSDEDFWRDADVSYYANGWNDGHIQTGWKQLTVMNEKDEEKDYWFYFGSDGVMQKDKQKKINGVKYSFAEDGHMLDDWVAGTNGDVTVNTTAGELNFFNGDGGQRKNKWIYAVPAEDYIPDDYNDDEYRWFYLNASGKVTSDTIKRINGKKYAFDAKGVMKKNFVYTAGNDDLTYAGSFKNDKVDRDDFIKVTGEVAKITGDLYYFSDDEKNDGSMKKGYQTITLDDDTYQFYFDTSNGKAKNGYVDKIKKFVAHGLIIKPTDDDPKYVAVKGATVTADGIKEDANDTFEVVKNRAAEGGVMINKQGTVVKKQAKLKDDNDHYYIVNKNGVVLKYFSSEDDYDAFTTALKTKPADSAKVKVEYRSYCSAGEVTASEIASQTATTLSDAFAAANK